MVSGILLLKPAPQVIRMQVSVYHSLRDKYSGHGKSLVPGRPGPKFHHISDVIDLVLKILTLESNSHILLHNKLK